MRQYRTAFREKLAALLQPGDKMTWVEYDALQAMLDDAEREAATEARQNLQRTLREALGVGQSQC